MEMENDFTINVEYAKIPLHKRYSEKPVSFECLPPSFGATIRPNEVERICFHNFSVSLNERFSSYKNVNKIEKTNKKNEKSNLILLYGILKKRNALLSKLLRLTISKVSANMNVQKQELIRQKRMLEKNWKKKNMYNPLNNLIKVNSRYIITKHFKEKLDHELNVYMSKHPKLMSKKYVSENSRDKRNVYKSLEIRRSENSRGRKFKEKLDYELDLYISQNPKSISGKYFSKKNLPENVCNPIERPRNKHSRCSKATKYKEKLNNELDVHMSQNPKLISRSKKHLSENVCYSSERPRKNSLSIKERKFKERLDHELDEYMSQKYFFERNSEGKTTCNPFEILTFENSDNINEENDKEKLDEELDVYMSQKPQPISKTYFPEINVSETTVSSPLESPSSTNSFIEEKKCEMLDYDLEEYKPQNPQLMFHSDLSENNMVKTEFDSSEIPSIESSDMKTNNYEEWLDPELKLFMSQNPIKTQVECYWDDINITI